MSRTRRIIAEVSTALLCAALLACDAPPASQSFEANTAPTRDTHPYFPISQGATHAAVACVECHPSTTFQPFALGCITCHTHNETAEQLDHANVAGFVYQSSSCYQCHPNAN